MMTCPVCGLLNPPNAGKCDCGFDFKTQTGGEGPPLWKRIRTYRQIFGSIVLGILVLYLLWKFVKVLFSG
jgi:hypothetical protein